MLWTKELRAVRLWQPFLHSQEAQFHLRPSPQFMNLFVAQSSFGYSVICWTTLFPECDRVKKSGFVRVVFAQSGKERLLYVRQ
jgi:hypothetical protein